ncbi:hypothetical protein LTR74_011345 [Friedmanniomyces endolithicus]|nr:hypothetical protein LTR74_011345 [Friedmanniomyces endolithicus]
MPFPSLPFQESPYQMLYALRPRESKLYRVGGIPSPLCPPKIPCLPQATNAALSNEDTALKVLSGVRSSGLKARKKQHQSQSRSQSQYQQHSRNCKATALPEAAGEKRFPGSVKFAVPFASVPLSKLPLKPPGNVKLTAPIPTVALLAFAKTMTVCSTITSVTGCTNCVTSSFRISSTAIARV